MLKMRRVFICCQVLFPRGSAASNYIQYLALALLDQGYNVYVLSNINPEVELETNEQGYQYKKINVIETKMSNNKLFHFIQYNYLKGAVFDKYLKVFHVCQEDLIILYSGDRRVHRHFLRRRRRYGFKTVCCMVEWFPREYYKSEMEFLLNEKSIRNDRVRHDLIFPISTYINNFFVKKEVNTLLLPIMADIGEFNKTKKNTSRIRFIFPGNGMMKDSLTEVLIAFTQLSDSEKELVELHICGVKEESIDPSVIKDASEKGYLIVHKWMKYEELISLYQQIHYLIIAREYNQMTLANFPSKVPECMCYGIVPVVSRVGDYTSLYLRDNYDSLIFEGYTADVCLKAIRRAINCFDEEYERMSNNALETVKMRFDYHVWEKQIADKIEGLYEE